MHNENNLRSKHHAKLQQHSMYCTHMNPCTPYGNRSLEWLYLAETNSTLRLVVLFLSPIHFCYLRGHYQVYKNSLNIFKSIDVHKMKYNYVSTSAFRIITAEFTFLSPATNFSRRRNFNKYFCTTLTYNFLHNFTNNKVLLEPYPLQISVASFRRQFCTTLSNYQDLPETIILNLCGLEDQ